MPKDHVFAQQLNSRQRSSLKGLAHALKPVVQLGNQGLTEGTLQAIRSAATCHELIKIQLSSGSSAEEKKAQEAELAEALGTRYHIAGRTGRMVVVYFEKEPAAAKLTLAALRNPAPQV